jgi:hypothetical protein
MVSRRLFWEHVRDVTLPSVTQDGLGLCAAVYETTRVFASRVSRAMDYDLYSRELRRLYQLKPSRLWGNDYWWPTNTSGYRARRRIVNRLIREDIRPKRRLRPLLYPR